MWLGLFFMNLKTIKTITFLLNPARLIKYFLIFLRGEVDARWMLGISQ